MGNNSILATGHQWKAKAPGRGEATLRNRSQVKHLRGLGGVGFEGYFKKASEEGKGKESRRTVSEVCSHFGFCFSFLWNHENSEQVQCQSGP